MWPPKWRRKRGASSGVDQYITGSEDPRVEFKKWDIDAAEFPVDVAEFDQIFLLDVIEHLHDPEAFMERLREMAVRKRPEIVLTTGNVAFFITRFMLSIGNFNYGRKGILDRTHTRLFTFNSLRELFDQTGYQLLEVKGVPAPFPKARRGKLLWATPWCKINQVLIKFLPKVFSYQIFIRAKALPTVPALLHETITTSAELRKAELATT